MSRVHGGMRDRRFPSRFPGRRPAIRGPSRLAWSAMRLPRRLAALTGAVLVAAASLAVSVASPSGATVATPPGIPQPRADILVDAGTGHVLIADNAHLALHTASTAKIMTALTA